MNSHLNVFKTYTNTYRTFQLENDLTRAFAISLQEDSLFFHEVLKEILKETTFYAQFFDSLESETNISIDIQNKAGQIKDYEHIFAVTLSETQIKNFWESQYNRNYDPICDLVIKINNIYFVIEAKRDNVDCTSQLYNQILNIINVEDKNITSLDQSEFSKIVTPVDLNWSKLMVIAVRVLSFEQSFGNANRFLTDFISLIRNHNFRWLPEVAINSLQSNNKKSIIRRIESAIIEASKINSYVNKLPYNDRLGISFNKGWAQEILFNINDMGNLTISIYPGNTKNQGYSLFRSTPNFKEFLEIQGEKFPVHKTYHIKFTSFQKFFTGLWFGDDNLKNELYTTSNFNKFTGRKKRGKDWDEIEQLFENSMNFDWKKSCKWNDLIINSGKNQFDISFGYEIFIEVPFNKLRMIDSNKSDLNNLTNLIIETFESYNNNLLNTCS